MLLTYTYLYKIITISLKTIDWRQLVKPSRYRNTMYTYIYQEKSDTVFVRQLPTPTLASETFVDLAVESLEKVVHGGSSTANA